jgi:hypothetical protein
VENYVKPAVLKRIEPNQYGAIPNSSTTIALLSMLQSWKKATDGKGAAGRVLLLDFKKAFDLIDYHLLVENYAYSIYRNGFKLDYGFSL